MSPAMRIRVGAVALFVVLPLFVAIACDDQAAEIADQNEAADTPSSGSDSESGDKSVFELRAGDCITSTFSFATVEEAETSVVACDSPDAVSKVLQLVRVAEDDEYPGESYFDEEAAANCDPFFDSFYFPTEESWAADDRTIICIQTL